MKSLFIIYLIFVIMQIISKLVIEDSLNIKEILQDIIILILIAINS